MKMKIFLISLACTCFALISCGQGNNKKNDTMTAKISKSEQQWKQDLSPEEFEILRKKGTERAFTGDLWDHHEDGTYTCAGCGQSLFTSGTKFESGSGWPSFYEPIAEDNVKIVKDTSYGMIRKEVVCNRCEGHLGHIFSDGPKPTGLRYCINSVSLNFEKKKKK